MSTLAPLLVLMLANGASAQSGDVPAPAPTPTSPGAPTPPAVAAPTPTTPPATDAQKLDPVQVTGTRADDVQERRRSTASKIVIGREEIDRYGDSTLGEVLKRLPGVTIQGQPGRGGAIRFRGLGNGYTQILLDGERVPPGFSLDSISPDEIERIEILRAPTAETGARAIAGTINIVTRGGYTKRVNDLRLSSSFHHGGTQPAATWTRNIASGPFIVNYSLTAFAYEGDVNRSRTTTTDRSLATGETTLEQMFARASRARGAGLHGTGRLQWSSDDKLDAVTLTPILFDNRYRYHGDGTLAQTLPDVETLPPPYTSTRTDGHGGSALARLNAEWTHRLGGSDRIETRAGYGQSRAPSDSVRVETGGLAAHTFETSGDSRDGSFTSSVKLIKTLFEEHSLVTGGEFESNRLTDHRISLEDGVPYLLGFDDNVAASATRFAAYAQDEWSFDPHWAAHAGLRWEGIATRGTSLAGEPETSNRSSVWTPLLHGVWKPDPNGRDQVRMSLTRSYRSPLLNDLIARPRIDTTYAPPGPNTPTEPDRAGNPALRPELATGIDIAVERYLPGSGLLSANVFRRNLSNYMRSVTTLETVSYSPVPRYVLRPQNVGSATTEGIELEAKFRASDLWPDAPRIDVRANASLFRSRVRDVAGPDNRLDQQPDGTGNVGADYRFAGLPLTIGGNVNYTPGYTTRLSNTQTASIGGKFLVDAYALWVFNPNLQLRFSASNLDPRVYEYGSTVDGNDLLGRPVRETSTTTSPTFVNLQLRLEMKL